MQYFIMKRLVFLLFAVMTGLIGYAQDMILLHNAEEIQAKVKRITATDVVYVRWDNQEGPEYIVSKSDIVFIKYQNGLKESFANEYNRIKNSDKDDVPLKFQAYVMVGCIFYRYGFGPSVDVNLGVKLGKYIHLGVEAGFYYMMSDISKADYIVVEYDGVKLDKEPKGSFLHEAYVPLGLNVKGYIPTQIEKLNVYVNGTIGGFFGVINMFKQNGLNCQVGAGVDDGYISYGIGYSCLHIKSTVHLGYIKIGVRF